MSPTSTWIATANSDHCIVYVHTKIGSSLEKSDAILNLSRPADDADKQGRVFSSTRDGQRNVYEASTASLDKSRQDFANHIAQMLKKAADKGEFKRLVLAFNPPLMHEIKAALPESVKQMVLHETDRDWTNTKPEKIVQQLDGIVLL